VVRFAAFLSAAWLIAGLISALFWIGLENASPIEYSQHSEARMTVFVLGLVFLVIAAALILRTGEASRPRGSGVRKAEVLAGILLSVLAGLGIWGLTLRPAWADIAALNARAYESVGDAASAAQLYERAVQLSPHVVQYHFYHGLAQLKAAGSDPVNLEKARASFQSARDLNPLDPVVYRTLGTFHTHVGEHSPDLKIRTAEITKAINYFDKAHLLTPNYPNAYNEKGRCLSLLGDYAAAEKIFQKSIQLNPDYWRSYKYLGEMQYRQKNFAGALQSFTTAAQINPDDIDSPRNIGVLLSLLGRTGEAIRVTLETLKKAPNDSALLANLSSWYFASGDYSSGMDYAKRAYETAPSTGKGSFEQFVDNLKNQKWQ
jgi:tetratricopeptide (TPR) repeat protein